MPWQKGFVPSDGYRMYIHGTNYKIEFGPCGCVLEHYSDENMDDIGKEMMDYTSKNFQKKNGQLKKRQRCPKCNQPITQIRKDINVNHSKMSESQFKASRIMGWA